MHGMGRNTHTILFVLYYLILSVDVVLCVSLVLHYMYSTTPGKM